jgi:FeS assembly SUF system regulator
MLRIARMTDYATLMMVELARDGALPASATRLAETLGLPQPTVAKLLKKLQRADLVTSVRGAGGGYRLAHAPRTITFADVRDAVEGPLALTACAARHGACALEAGCTTREHWRVIGAAIDGALRSVSLADMMDGAPRPVAMQQRKERQT